MPPIPTTQRMGELHEQHVARALVGLKTRASGAGVDKGDGAHHHDDPFAFRWDAKSTKGKQIAITLAMIEKICEQAGGERPAIPLRWYGNEALTEVLEDWIAVKLVDFSELLTAAQEGQEWMERCDQALREGYERGQERDRLQEQLDLQRAEMAPLRTRLAQAEEWKETQVQVQAGAVANTPAVPGYVPMLPWTVVHAVHTAGTVKHSGIHYDDMGHQQTFDVGEVRVERSPNSANRPRLIVNTVRVAQGALYVDGVLRALVCSSNREIEVG